MISFIKATLLILFNLIIFFQSSLPFAESSFWYHEIFEWQSIYTPVFSHLVGPNDFNSFHANLSIHTITDLCFSKAYISSSSNDYNKNIELFNKKINGKMALYKDIQKGCSYEEMLRTVQDAGGVALLKVSKDLHFWGYLASFSHVPSSLTSFLTSFLFGFFVGELIEESNNCIYCLDYSNKDDLVIPFLTAVPKDSNSLLHAIDNAKENSDIMIQVSANPNPYIDMLRIASIVFYCIYIPWAVINIVLAMDTFRFFYIREGGLELHSLPQVALSFELVCGIIRLIYMSGGGFFTSNTFWSFSVSAFLLAFPTPFGDASSLVVALWWHATNTKLKVFSQTSVNLAQFSTHLIIIIIIEAIVAWAAAITASLYYSIGLVTIVNAIWQIFVASAVSSYFIIQGTKLIKQIKLLTMKKSGIWNVKREIYQRTIHRLTIWMIFAGIFSIVRIIGSIALGSPLLYNSKTVMIVWLLLATGNYGISTTQILAFRTQKSFGDLPDKFKSSQDDEMKQSTKTPSIKSGKKKPKNISIDVNSSGSSSSVDDDNGNMTPSYNMITDSPINLELSENI